MEMPEGAVPLPEGATPIYDTDGTSGLGDVINNMHEEVYKMARESGGAPKGFREDVEAFVAAVDWTEQWIQALLAFHLLLWVTTLLTRKRFYWQCGTFFFVTVLVAASETLNTIAHLRWQTFSKQDYFDKHGFFFGVMYSGPLLLVAMFQMVNFLMIAANLLVDVKRKELHQTRQKDKKKSE